MKPWLLDHLKCPLCQDGSQFTLRAREFQNGEIFAGSLGCGAGHSFEIAEYIADFVQPEDDVSKKSHAYDVVWDAHARQTYDGRVDEYRQKFQAFANLPGNLGDYFAGKCVLDAGCGEGRFTYLASVLEARRVVAVDYSKEALRRAIAGTGNPPNCSFIRANILNLPLSRTFDYIFSMGVLHHTPDPHEAYRAIVRHLKTGGYVTVFVYGKSTFSWYIWPLRRFSLRVAPERIRGLCDTLGFGYDPSVTPRFPLARVFGRRRPGRGGRVPGSWTCEALTTPHLHEHSLEEVRRWFVEAGVELISIREGVAASGRLAETAGTFDDHGESPSL